MLNTWMALHTNGARSGLAHIGQNYSERTLATVDATAIITRILEGESEPIDLVQALRGEDHSLALRDLDHARAVARAKAAARPTWEQEKRWFKERLDRKRYAEAIGEVCQ